MTTCIGRRRKDAAAIESCHCEHGTCSGAPAQSGSARRLKALHKVFDGISAVPLFCSLPPLVDFGRRCEQQLCHCCGELQQNVRQWPCDTLCCAAVLNRAHRGLMKHSDEKCSGTGQCRRSASKARWKQQKEKSLVQWPAN